MLVALNHHRQTAAKLSLGGYCFKAGISLWFNPLNEPDAPVPSNS